MWSAPASTSTWWKASRMAEWETTMKRADQLVPGDLIDLTPAYKWLSLVIHVGLPYYPNWRQIPGKRMIISITYGSTVGCETIMSSIFYADEQLKVLECQ